MSRLSLSAVALGLLVGCGSATPPSGSSQAVTATENTHSPTANPAAGQAPAAHQPSYQQLCDEAQARFQARDANQAVKLLTQAIALEPKRVDAYVKRAAILAEAKLVTNAIHDMTSALKIDPDNPKLLNTRGYFLLISQQIDRAIEDFSDAIGLDLQYPQPYNNRGLCWISQRQFENAIKDFDNALRAKPDYIDAHNNRGFALMQLERYDEAIGAFSNALEIDEKYINAVTNRGRCYLAARRYSEAASDFTTAISLQPDTMGHYQSRSEALRLNGDEAGAVADLSMINWLQTLEELNQRILRNRQDADAWTERARHLLSRNRTEEADRSLQNALTLKPSHPGALAVRAQQAMQRSDYEQVIQDCTAALNQEHHFETFSLRGDAAFALKRYGEAIADYEAARRFDRKVVEAYRLRAAQLRQNGDEQLAQADEKYASGLEKQLTDADIKPVAGTPRAMVVEQVNYEEAAPAQVK